MCPQIRNFQAKCTEAFLSAIIAYNFRDQVIQCLITSPNEKTEK